MIVLQVTVIPKIIIENPRGTIVPTKTTIVATMKFGEWAETTNTIERVVTTRRREWAEIIVDTETVIVTTKLGE